STSVTTTSKPRPASMRATASPSPPPAPVTSAEGTARAYGHTETVRRRADNGESPSGVLLGFCALQPSLRIQHAEIGDPVDGASRGDCRVARTFSASPTANPV